MSPELTPDTRNAIDDLDENLEMDDFYGNAEEGRPDYDNSFDYDDDEFVLDEYDYRERYERNYYRDED